MGSEKLFEVDMAQSPEDRIRTFFSKATSHPGWDHTLLPEISVVRAGPRKAEFEFTVTEAMCNQVGILHGGCATTILDVLTSSTLFSATESAASVGLTLSRTLTVTFLRAIPAGVKVRALTEIVQLGRKTAHLTGTLETMDGQVCVSCVHDKAVVTPKM